MASGITFLQVSIHSSHTPQTSARCFLGAWTSQKEVSGLLLLLVLGYIFKPSLCKCRSNQVRIRVFPPTLGGRCKHKQNTFFRFLFHIFPYSFHQHLLFTGQLPIFLL